MFSEKDIQTAASIVENFSFPDEFGPDEFDSERVTEFIYEQLPAWLNASVESGISKIVIIPYDYSFVIKIPFNGRFMTIWEDKFKDEDEDEIWKDPDWKEIFVKYNNASYNGGFDYCARELDLIQDAQHFGWGFMMPETDFLGMIDGYPIYIQEKVQSGARGQTSADSLERARLIDSYYKQGPEEWRAAVIEKYGEPIWCSFVNWCFKREGDYNPLSDLHRSNVGIAYDGRPVILDVGGFDD